MSLLYRPQSTGSFTICVNSILSCICKIQTGREQNHRIYTYVRQVVCKCVFDALVCAEKQIRATNRMLLVETVNVCCNARALLLFLNVITLLLFFLLLQFFVWSVFVVHVNSIQLLSGSLRTHTDLFVEDIACLYSVIQHVQTNVYTNTHTFIITNKYE